MELDPSSELNWSKIVSPILELECSLPCSQEHIASLSPEPDNSYPYSVFQREQMDTLIIYLGLYTGICFLD